MKLTLHPTKPFVIAELGTSCDGSVGNMVELARHAVAAGASAIKIQDHSFQQVPSGATYPTWFQGSQLVEPRWAYLRRQSQNALAEREEQHVAEWVDCLRKAGPQVPIIASVFSVDALHMEPKPDAYKIASGQVTNRELIRACVATGRPILISGGMTTREELRAACELIPGGQLWCVMACSSLYPCPPERVSIPASRAEHAWHRGYSDHSPPGSSAAAVVALTRGCRVFERHITFDQRQYGSDAKYASTIEQFESYCRDLEYAARIPCDEIQDANAVALSETREAFLVQT